MGPAVDPAGRGAGAVGPAPARAPQPEGEDGGSGGRLPVPAALVGGRRGGCSSRSREGKKPWDGGEGWRRGSRSETRGTARCEGAPVREGRGCWRWPCGRPQAAPAPRLAAEGERRGEDRV